MAEVLDIEKVTFTGEFRECPACGYERGFHLSLVGESGDAACAVILICPSCGARYDVGKRL